MPDFSPMPEVFVSNAELAPLVSRETKQGWLRKIGSRLYTRNLREPAERIVQRNLWPLVASYLPGALIAAVPAIVNMLIILSKETVVLSIITVPELMYQVQTMAAETFTAFDAIFAMAIFYWLLVETVSRLGSRVETRMTAFLAHEAKA